MEIQFGSKSTCAVCGKKLVAKEYDNYGITIAEQDVINSDRAYYCENCYKPHCLDCSRTKNGQLQASCTCNFCGGRIVH